jgi:hypothetical protein
MEDWPHVSKKPAQGNVPLNSEEFPQKTWLAGCTAEEPTPRNYSKNMRYTGALGAAFIGETSTV